MISCINPVRSFIIYCLIVCKLFFFIVFLCFLFPSIMLNPFTLNFCFYALLLRCYSRLWSISYLLQFYHPDLYFTPSFQMWYYACWQISVILQIFLFIRHKFFHVSFSHYCHAFTSLSSCWFFIIFYFLFFTSCFFFFMCEGKSKLSSKELNVYTVADHMAKKGWSLNPLQNPPCVHICCTLRHVGKEQVSNYFHSAHVTRDKIQATIHQSHSFPTDQSTGDI